MTYQTEPNEEKLPVCLVLTVGELERLVNAADNRLVDKTCCEATDCKCVLEEMTEEESDQCRDRQVAEQEQLSGARSKIVSWVREALKRTWMPDQRLDKVVTWTCKVHDPVTGAECGHVNHTSISQASIPDCERCKFSKYVSDCAGATG